jgi:4-coumarate--CoA ligase
VNYVMPRFTKDRFIECIERHGITSLPVVPPIALSIFAGKVKNEPVFSSLRDVVCAGAPLGRDVQLQLSACLPPAARFVQLWGMSELGWVTAFSNEERDESGSVGRLLPNVRVKLVDGDGVEITTEGQGQRGELWVSNPASRMSGYLDETGADINAVNGHSEQEKEEEDEWFRTGDIGYCEQGKWYIVDRAKVNPHSPLPCNPTLPPSY